MRTIIRIMLPAALALLIASPATAKKTSKKARGEMITIQVADLNAKTPRAKTHKLRRALLKIKGVTRVRMSSKNHTIVIGMKSPEQRRLVEQAIAKHGFSITRPKQTPEPVVEAEVSSEPAVDLGTDDEDDLKDMDDEVY